MTERTERIYHVGFAVARLDTLDDNLSEALQASWSTEAYAVRYNRRWRLSRKLDNKPEYVHGRIGFVAENEVATLAYDEENEDFIEGATTSGRVVPFVFRVNDGVIAFQLFPGVVRESTFTNALEAVLNKNRTLYNWEISPLAKEMAYDQWRSTVTGVHKFDFTLQRPNPNYRDRPIIEAMIESTRLEAARLVGKALPGEMIDETSDFFQQALDHAVMRNYGNARMYGERHASEESIWIKIRDFAGHVLSKREIVDSGPEQAPERVLLAALTSTSGADASVRLPEWPQYED